VQATKKALFSRYYFDFLFNLLYIVSVTSKVEL